MNYTGKEADGNAANWMNRPGVRERVAELKEANSRKATLSREQTIEFLCNVISTSAAKVTRTPLSCNQRNSWMASQ